MNGDSKIVDHLPEIFQEMKQDVYKVLGAGVVCYFTYRVFKYLYIRRNVLNLRDAKKQEFEAKTAKIQKLIENCGVSKDEMNKITIMSWDELVGQLKSGIIQINFDKMGFPNK